MYFVSIKDFVEEYHGGITIVNEILKSVSIKDCLAHEGSAGMCAALSQCLFLRRLNWHLCQYEINTLIIKTRHYSFTCKFLQIDVRDLKYAWVIS